MVRALVIGANGLLGSQLIKKLYSSGFDVIGTYRNQKPKVDSGIRLEQFAVGDSLEKLLSHSNPDFVYNCTVAKFSKSVMPHSSLRTLMLVNAFFPRRLHHAVKSRGGRLFSFSTDAVFAGRRNACDEIDRRIPNSMYGVSKMLGEYSHTSNLLLRFSMVAAANELSSKNHLSHRIATLPRNAKISVSTRSNWNGVTVGLLAELVANLSQQDDIPNGTRHFFSSKIISKFELVTLLAKCLGRDDLIISPLERNSQNAALTTRFNVGHDNFWKKLGFAYIPDIETILKS